MILGHTHRIDNRQPAKSLTAVEYQFASQAEVGGDGRSLTGRDLRSGLAGGTQPGIFGKGTSATYPALERAQPTLR